MVKAERECEAEGTASRYHSQRFITRNMRAYSERKICEGENMRFK